MGPGPLLEQCFSYCHAAFAGPWVLCSVNLRSEGLGLRWAGLRRARRVLALLGHQHTSSPAAPGTRLPRAHHSPRAAPASCAHAGAARSAFPQAALAHSLLLGTSFGQGRAPLRTRLTCGLQWGATAAAPTSLGFNFISLWHKGEFLSPGDALFPSLFSVSQPQTWKTSRQIK